jgi:GntR family transcriptional regulator
VLDKRSHLPLHQQLKATIEEHILSGEWLPGTQVPSERELCEQYDISRITVRQALTALVMEGRLIRAQGRGTFVGSPRIEQQLTQLTGFTQDMQARGKRPSTEKLAARSLYDILTKKYRLQPVRAMQQMEAIAYPAAEAKLLGTRRGAPVLHIRRTTYDRAGRPFELAESFYRGDRYTFYAELQGDRLAGDASQPGEKA